MVAAETSGTNQRRNGAINRDVCSADIKSVEPMKMKIIQSRTGSQNFRNPRTENETTTAALVLISRRGKSEAHPTSGFRAAFHGARLGRASSRIALRETIALGGAHR